MGRTMIQRFDSVPEAHWTSIISSPSSAESAFRELDDVFLQTQARIWLGEVLHTRLDEETPVADLLADGKLLFQVSRVVWKMLLTKCIKLRYSRAYFSESMKSGKNSWRYMPYSNVDSFLRICQMLGLTGIDLFSPSDVVEKKDIRRVCMCIRSLSKKARSKDLNVPDFDVVTYTLTMPTDMVGCIRKSLEQSWDGYSKSSDYCSPHMDGKPIYRQRSWDVGYAQEYDLYSEEYEDSGNNYGELGFHSPSSTTYDDVSLMTSDAENSPDGSLVIMENLISPYSTLSLVPDQEKDCGSSPLLICETDGTSFVNDKAARRALSEPANDLMGFSPVDLHQGNGASSVGNRLKNHNKLEGNLFLCSSGMSDSIGHGTGNVESFYFYGGRKDRVFDLDTAAACPGSSSINKNLRLKLESRSPDMIEDAKAHCPDTHGFISGKVDTRYYEGKFEENGANPQGVDNVKVSFNVVSNVPKIKVVDKCGNCAAMSDTDQKQLNSEDFRCWNSVSSGNGSKGSTAQQSFFRDHSTSCIENSSLGKSLVQDKVMPQLDLDIPEDKHVLPSSISVQSTESGCIVLGHPKLCCRNPLLVNNSVKDPVTLESGLDISEDEHGNPSISLDENILHVTHQGFTNQGDTTLSVGNVVGEKREEVETSEGKSRKRNILKSVAGGVTLVGVFFFLFNFRRKGRKETNPSSIQVGKCNNLEDLSKLNRQKSRVHGIYPGDKLRFQD